MVCDLYVAIADVFMDWGGRLLFEVVPATLVACIQWWLMLGYKCCDPLKGGQFSPWSVMECTCLLVSSFSLVLG